MLPTYYLAERCGLDTRHQNPKLQPEFQRTKGSPGVSLTLCEPKP